MADDPYERQVREGCERAAALAARIAAEGVDAVGRQLRRAWIETELPSRCLDTWATIWEAVRDGDARAAVMTGRERKRLDRLPERVTVYRGSTAGGERGWSWTLDRDIAEDFAQRHTEDDPAGL
ncbi:MAG: hypothetical protein Q4F65_10875, partial [Propionibacteriaceae bacterium]|nr:hypothetical protein [Propionibacteriaceae bacterium]